MLNLKKLNKGRAYVKLDIGAGGFSNDDEFLSVDLFTEADIIAPMWEIPLPDESVDIIFSSQALEHIPKEKVIPTLKEWARLLKPGGKLQAIVPDLEWCCMWWLTHQDTSWSMDILYGHQKHEGEFHRTGFSMNIIGLYFLEVPELKLLKMEYIGGTAELRLTDDARVAEDVAQKLIVVEGEKVFTTPADQISHVDGRAINIEAQKNESS